MNRRQFNRMVAAGAIGWLVEGVPRAWGQADSVLGTWIWISPVMMLKPQGPNWPHPSIGAVYTFNADGSFLYIYIVEHFAGPINGRTTVTGSYRVDGSSVVFSKCVEKWEHYRYTVTGARTDGGAELGPLASHDARPNPEDEGVYPFQLAPNQVTIACLGAEKGRKPYPFRRQGHETDR